MSDSGAEELLAQQLGRHIAQLRVARGLSQEALAHRAKISNNHVQLLESGLSDRQKKSPANPRLGTLLSLSRALDVPLATLLDGIG
ncbi:MAG: helix-turn-helix transcriptional regulator [Gordonia sp. (in: high G+C Gram-positive bacteria)]|uniref:helix-turn-helix domain-containing protein n=1 Tax=Gordonia sp. (in: high G+C Gram-positive bacteria) TaxID=84139 RepID=UPI0039E493F8